LKFKNLAERKLKKTKKTKQTNLVMSEMGIAMKREK